MRIRTFSRLSSRLRTAAAVLAAFVAVPLAGVAAAPPAQAATLTHGIDVSNFQETVNWSTVARNGYKFAYVYASEGLSTKYSSRYFASQYNGAYDAGLIRGAYHVARPATSSGSAQAAFFVRHGGGWSPDGRTLPGALDLEPGSCVLSKAGMRNWITSFQNTYRAATGRYAVLYVSAGIWPSCVGNWSPALNYPLWVADYTPPVTVPAPWGYHSFWQYSDSTRVSGVSGNRGITDRDVFNGSLSQLRRFARG